MRRLFIVAGIAGWGWTAANAVAQVDREPLGIYVAAEQVTPAPADQQKAIRKELETKASQARKALKVLEDGYKKQYGKKTEEWPPEKQAEYRVAANASGAATLQLAYFGIGQAPLEDSAADIRKSIAGEGMAGAKRILKVVDSADQAHVVAHVIGRRSQSQPPLIFGLMIVGVKISAGGRANGDAIANLPPKWSSRYFELHAPTAGEPYWTIESSGTERFGNAANTAAKVIEALVTDHYDALAGRPTSPRQ